jgi:hypothetical protein
VALICTLPGDEPRVTFVFACPFASVVVVPGETVAVPLVTANVTVTPASGAPVVEVTLTVSGVERAWPTKPTWPLPETI